VTFYNHEISKYITGLFALQDTALIHTLQDSAQRGLPAISIQPEEGRFLQFLVRASGARRVIEIGTLGGYSGIWIARGLAPGGKLITLEKEPFHARVAEQHFALAGLADRIEVRVGEALRSLASLAAEGPFDFVFIDAEKPDYPSYFEWALVNLRVGGVMAAHNAFRKGDILNRVDPEENTRILQDFNQRASREPRLISTIYPGGDGMLVGVKIA